MLGYPAGIGGTHWSTGVGAVPGFGFGRVQRIRMVSAVATAARRSGIVCGRVGRYRVCRAGCHHRQTLLLLVVVVGVDAVAVDSVGRLQAAHTRRRGGLASDGLGVRAARHGKVNLLTHLRAQRTLKVMLYVTLENIFGETINCCGRAFDEEMRLCLICKLSERNNTSGFFRHSFNGNYVLLYYN